jgi:hypothetical protein
VVGPGPDPGTSWAVPGDPTVAGVIVDHGTRGHRPLTRDEQAARMARAELVLARGAVIASHRLPAGSTDPHENRVHLTGCTELTGKSARLLVDGMWTRVQRSDVALAALRGEASVQPVPGADRQPAAWCPTCLGDAP